MMEGWKGGWSVCLRVCFSFFMSITQCALIYTHLDSAQYPLFFAPARDSSYSRVVYPVYPVKYRWRTQKYRKLRAGKIT